MQTCSSSGVLLRVNLLAKECDSLQVLVTGGAGYIGSHTAKALAQAGYESRDLMNGKARGMVECEIDLGRRSF